MMAGGIKQKLQIFSFHLFGLSRGGPRQAKSLDKSSPFIVKLRGPVDSMYDIRQYITREATCRARLLPRKKL